MAITTINLSDNMTTFVSKTNTISNNLGDIATLTTIDSDVVSAVNRLDSEIEVLDSDLGDVSAVRTLFGTGLAPDLSTAVISTLNLINTLDSSLTNVSDALISNARSGLTGTNSGEGYGSLAYDSDTGVFTYTKVTDANIRERLEAANSGTGYGSLAYNSTNGTFTYTKVTDANIRERLAVTDTGGDGSLTYNSTNGTFTYTGPSASEVRAHLSAGEGIDFSNGVISAELATTSNKGVAAFNSNDFSVTSGAVSIRASGVSNNQLENSSVTINGVSVSLGGSTTGNFTGLNIFAAANNIYDIGSPSTGFRTMYATTFSGRATSANYADLAEKYLADEEYAIGTVMSVGGAAEVTAADDTNSHSVLGVVSENPAFRMNEDLDGGTYIALKGRVPVRVNGTVRKGDRLVPSSTKGVAEVNNDRNAWSFAIALHDAESYLVEAVIL